MLDVQKFRLSDVTSKLLNTPEYRKNNKVDHVLILKEHAYRQKLWLSFYFALISTSIFTAILVEETNLAGHIMARARAARRPPTNTHFIQDDFSSFSITTEPGLFALVFTPSGKRAGDTFDGIRYTEVASIDMTSHRNLTNVSTTNWSIVADKPETGDYKIQFGTNDDGIYEYTITLYDASGNRKMIHGSIQSVTAIANQYVLHYDRLDVQNSILQPNESIQ